MTYINIDELIFSQLFKIFYAIKSFELSNFKFVNVNHIIAQTAFSLNISKQMLLFALVSTLLYLALLNI